MCVPRAFADLVLIFEGRLQLMGKIDLPVNRWSYYLCGVFGAEPRGGSASKPWHLFCVLAISDARSVCVHVYMCVCT